MKDLQHICKCVEETHIYIAGLLISGVTVSASLDFKIKDLFYCLFDRVQILIFPYIFITNPLFNIYANCANTYASINMMELFRYILAVNCNHFF